MPTRSRRAELHGAQVPRVRHAPKVRGNEWEDVADLAKAYGLVLDEWQENVLEAAMGVRSDGRWAATTVGVNVPRQNGKGALIEARELAGLLLFGDKVIIHSAHEQKTTRVGFERVLAYFENYDDLRKKVRSVMSALGRENIKLRNGAELHFPARSKGAIRGFSIDCLILDEAQILGDPAWEAIKPTISARPNTQTWLLGTTPTPLDDSEVFTRTRGRGVEAKDLRLAWCEWSAPAGTSLDDRAAWALANPAMGLRISTEAVEDERAELSDDGFARERLGIWRVDEIAEQVIPRAAWDALATSIGPPPEQPPDALALDLFGTTTVVAAGWRTETGVHVELVAVDISPDSSRAVRWVTENAGRRIPVLFAADSPAASLVPNLQTARVRVVPVHLPDYGKACVGFHADVVAGAADLDAAPLSHAGQEQLDVAVNGAKKRSIGVAGSWGWDRRSPSSDIAPLVAATLARFGALTSKPKATRPGGRRAVVM